MILIWKSLCDSRHERYHSSSHLPFLRYLRSKQASSHCDFSNVTLCPQRPFCIKRKSFFPALQSLCNLLSVSLSLSLSMQKIGSDWKASFLIGNIWEVGSWAGGVPWRRVIMGFPHPWRVTGGGERRWRGFRGEAATQQSHHSSPSPQRYEVSGTATAGRRGSGCVNNTRDGLASELTVCLWLSDQWDMVFWISPQRHTNPILNHYLCSINNTKHSLNQDALIILWDLGLVHTNVWYWIECISVLDFFKVFIKVL